DYLDNIQVSLFDKKEQHKIKVFNWQDEFPEIFKKGGFDVVVGNPPYIFARNNMFTEQQKNYYYKHYPISEYQLNTYLMFTERASTLVKAKGLVGYIIPNNCLTINSFDRFRRFLVDEMSYLHIVNSFDKVFSGANVDICILIFGKEYQHTTRHSMGELRNGAFQLVSGDFTELLTKNYIINTTQCLDPNNPVPKIMDKMNELSKPLSQYVTVSDGLKMYEEGKGKPPQTGEEKATNKYFANLKQDDSYQKMLLGSDVKRYNLEWSDNWISYGEWLAAPRKKELFLEPRILVRQVIAKYPYLINAVYTTEPLFNEQSVKIIREFEQIDSLFVLGIINSKITSFWLDNALFKSSRKLFPRVVIKDIEQFPIPTLDLTNKKDKALHDDLVSKVQLMLELQKDDKNDTTKLQIEALDRQIDRLVYQMYGLTEDEIRVVENE
ncbi:MAG: Eco57I restriction-modification methylase domain-containing protein, partial [Brevinema sp.]